MPSPHVKLASPHHVLVSHHDSRINLSCIVIMPVDDKYILRRDILITSKHKQSNRIESRRLDGLMPAYVGDLYVAFSGVTVAASVDGREKRLPAYRNRPYYKQTSIST